MNTLSSIAKTATWTDDSRVAGVVSDGSAEAADEEAADEEEDPLPTSPPCKNAVRVKRQFGPTPQRRRNGGTHHDDGRGTPKRHKVTPCPYRKSAEDGDYIEKRLNIEAIVQQGDFDLASISSILNCFNNSVFHSEFPTFPLLPGGALAFRTGFSDVKVSRVDRFVLNVRQDRDCDHNNVTLMTIIELRSDQQNTSAFCVLKAVCSARANFGKHLTYYSQEAWKNAEIETRYHFPQNFAYLLKLLAKSKEEEEERRKKKPEEAPNVILCERIWCTSIFISKHFGFEVSPIVSLDANGTVRFTLSERAVKDIEGGVTVTFIPAAAAAAAPAAAAPPPSFLDDSRVTLDINMRPDVPSGISWADKIIRGDAKQEVEQKVNQLESFATQSLVNRCVKNDNVKPMIEECLVQEWFLKFIIKRVVLDPLDDHIPPPKPHDIQRWLYSLYDVSMVTIFLCQIVPPEGTMEGTMPLLGPTEAHICRRGSPQKCRCFVVPQQQFSILIVPVGFDDPFFEAAESHTDIHPHLTLTMKAKEQQEYHFRKSDSTNDYFELFSFATTEPMSRKRWMTTEMTRQLDDIEGWSVKDHHYFNIRFKRTGCPTWEQMDVPAAIHRARQLGSDTTTVITTLLTENEDIDKLQIVPCFLPEGFKCQTPYGACFSYRCHPFAVAAPHRPCITPADLCLTAHFREKQYSEQASLGMAPLFRKDDGSVALSRALNGQEYGEKFATHVKKWVIGSIVAVLCPRKHIVNKIGTFTDITKTPIEQHTGNDLKKLCKYVGPQSPSKKASAGAGHDDSIKYLAVQLLSAWDEKKSSFVKSSAIEHIDANLLYVLFHPSNIQCARNGGCKKVLFSPNRLFNTGSLMRGAIYHVITPTSNSSRDPSKEQRSLDQRYSHGVDETRTVTAGMRYPDTEKYGLRFVAHPNPKVWNSFTIFQQVPCKLPPRNDGGKSFDGVLIRPGSDPSSSQRGTYHRDPFAAPCPQGYPETSDWANWTNCNIVDDRVFNGTRKQLYPATRHGGVDACVEDSSSQAGLDRTFADTKSWKCKLAPTMPSVSASASASSLSVEAGGLGDTQYRYVQHNPVLKSLSRSNLKRQPSVGTTLRGLPCLDHLDQIQAKEE